MSSYKTSKAWHYGHSLARDVHDVSWQLPKSDEFQLALHLRRTSAIPPTKLEESLQHTSVERKLRCYEVARQALIELHEHLTMARDLHYIDHKLFKNLAEQGIVAQRTLNEMIQAIKKETQWD